MHDLVGKIRRGIRKPPKVIVMRLLAMARTQTERLRLPRRARLSERALLRELQAPSLNALWDRLSARPFPAWFHAPDKDSLADGEIERIRALAEDALERRVDLLGSGPKILGSRIDWHVDFKTGFGWPRKYFADIEYNNPDRPSDVKVPWELSRLQWLVPAGQAYLLTGDEKFASGVRDVLDQWISENPLGQSVNWSCTMEAALRIFTWTWFFHMFKGARAWKDADFRLRFLRALYLHVEFTERHIERSDVNGNHYTADAAGMVMGGLFFGEGKKPKLWTSDGWRILCDEIVVQVFPDGVDFEASVPYHRLVTELFLWPARYRSLAGQEVDQTYLDRLAAMGLFAKAYSRPDGRVPLWGDADDARALPFGTQDKNDHGYLYNLIGCYTHHPELLDGAISGAAELFWTGGPELVRTCGQGSRAKLGSVAFPDGGFYVMRSEKDHVFIDCGPIGLAGRGGHGHNDCLSFEACLDGIPLITDCGAYLYTASYSERNSFRSTAFHNTPQVDGAEINRFIRPDYLWNMHYDAVPELKRWHVSDAYALFRGSHHGYRRLHSPVTPQRTIVLDFAEHAMLIEDMFCGAGEHAVRIPLHLAPDVDIVETVGCRLVIASGGKKFRLWWPEDSGYSFSVEQARVSPSYGVAVAVKRLVWNRGKSSLSALKVFIASNDSDDMIGDRLEKRMIEGDDDE